MLDRSRLVKNAAVLRFFCARRAERIKYRRFSKSCKVSPTSLWLITLGFTILIAPCQFFYFRKTFSGWRERTFFLTGFEKRRYLIFPAPLERRKILVPLRFSRSESAPTGKRFALSGRPGSHFKTSIPSNGFHNCLYSFSFIISFPFSLCPGKYLRQPVPSKRGIWLPQHNRYA